MFVKNQMLSDPKPFHLKKQNPSVEQISAMISRCDCQEKSYYERVSHFNGQVIVVVVLLNLCIFLDTNKSIPHPIPTPNTN